MIANVIFINVILLATSSSNMSPMHSFATSNSSVTELTAETILKTILKNQGLTKEQNQFRDQTER